MSMLTCMRGRPHISACRCHIPLAGTPQVAPHCSFARDEHQLTSKKPSMVQMCRMQLEHRCWPVGNMSQGASRVKVHHKGRIYDISKQLDRVTLRSVLTGSVREACSEGPRPGIRS